MISQIFVYPGVQERFHEGALAAHLDGFVDHQIARGYRLSSLRVQARLVAGLGGWLTQRRLAARDLDEGRIAAFLRQRKRSGHPRSAANALAAMLEYLRSQGVVGALPQAVPKAHELLVGRYDEHLQCERHVASATRKNYLRIARRFLVATDASSLAAMSADDVATYVRRLAEQHPRSAQMMTIGLRSFLRFLYVRDLLPVDLTAAVPPVASRRWERLPAFLSTSEVRRLLWATTPEAGGSHRDRALVLLLVRLGLRAGEVAGLSLDDIDWTQGVILVRGKAGRHSMPLPPDVGACLARYLRHERPPCATRSVFVRLRAPHVGFASSFSVGCVVARALRRAGLEPLHRGAHLLRHTAATQMLGRAAKLAEIGQVLGHRRVLTTAIYAHVDVTGLRRVALPWPHGGRR